MARRYNSQVPETKLPVTFVDALMGSITSLGNRWVKAQYGELPTPQELVARFYQRSDISLLEEARTRLKRSLTNHEMKVNGWHDDTPFEVTFSAYRPADYFLYPDTIDGLFNDEHHLDLATKFKAIYEAAIEAQILRITAKRALTMCTTLPQLVACWPELATFAEHHEDCRRFLSGVSRRGRAPHQTALGKRLMHLSNHVMLCSSMLDAPAYPYRINVEIPALYREEYGTYIDGLVVSGTQDPFRIEPVTVP